MTSLVATDLWIAERWQLHWSPWALIEARKLPDPAEALARLHQQHRSRLAACLNAGLSTSAIMHDTDLDDPRLATDAWEWAFRAALDRRERNFARNKTRKGAGRNHANQQRNSSQ